MRYAGSPVRRDDSAGFESGTAAAFAVERSSKEEQSASVECDGGVLDQTRFAFVGSNAGAVGASVSQHYPVNLSFDSAVVSRDVNSAQYEVAGRLLPRLFVSAKSGEGVSNLRSTLVATLVSTQSAMTMTPDASVELPDVLP